MRANLSATGASLSLPGFLVRSRLVIGNSIGRSLTTERSSRFRARTLMETSQMTGRVVKGYVEGQSNGAWHCASLCSPHLNLEPAVCVRRSSLSRRRMTQNGGQDTIWVLAPGVILKQRHTDKVNRCARSGWSPNSLTSG